MESVPGRLADDEDLGRLLANGYGLWAMGYGLFLESRPSDDAVELYWSTASHINL
jgi:hypothetical protein